jgi:uncharacterized protein YigE (DUF2233 family)
MNKNSRATFAGFWGLVVALCLALAAWPARPAAAEFPEASSCGRIMHAGVRYVICRFRAGSDDIRMFWAGDDGRPLLGFAALRRHLRARGLKLRFGMNGGMYTPRHAPAGLYVEAGRQIVPLNLRRGRGNFHLLPNGVFWLKGGQAGVTESRRFARLRIRPAHATQSGPMLVINGRIHPRFRPASESRKIRNGVGVAADGRTIYFVLSEDPVNFHTFARLFRDRLKTPNALFLDGTISQIYAPELRRYGGIMPMGPIIAVVEKASPGREN